MAFAQIDAITREKFLPKLEDNILSDSPFLRYVFGNAKMHNGGGRKLVVPVKFAKSTAGGSYGRGDTLDVSAQNTRTTLEFNWKSLYQSITIFGIDRALNAGTERVIDHVATSMEEAQGDLADKISSQLFADGTGNGSKDLLGIQAAVDDGTNVATYGGKTRSTDTWAQSTLSASIGSLAVTDLQTLYRGARSGAKRPKLLVTTETLFDVIEGFYTPTVQNEVMVRPTPAGDNFSATEGISGKLGFTELFYKGMPVIADEFCASGEIYMLNTDRLFMHVLKNQVFGNTKKMGIAMTEMKRPINQDGEVAQLLLYGELVTSEPRAHSKGTGATA